MPLPQEVINRLSEDRPATPEWSSSVLWFSFGLLALMVLLYAGIAFGYEPYVEGQTNAVTASVVSLDKSIPSGQASSLMRLYSQAVHAKSLLEGHVLFSRFLTWLGNDTEANVYYASLGFAAKNQVTLVVLAKSEADVNQQVAIFEDDPNVASVSVSTVSLASVSGFWQANVTLVMNPSVFATTGT
jgi:hypothetical protein